MANLIEIPYDDGTTQTNVLINGDAVFDIEISYDAGTGTKFNIGLQELGHYDDEISPAVKNINLWFAGSGHTSTDITIQDANSLKKEIRVNAAQPGKIGSWKPQNYNGDPVRYSITSYTSFNTPATDY